MVVSCVYGEQQERGGEGREEDEVGEGPDHWSTLLQRQRAFSLVLLIIFNSYCCGPRSWLWSMMDEVIDQKNQGEKVDEEELMAMMTRRRWW